MGKKVRTQTTIQGGQTSVGSVAVDLAADSAEGLDEGLAEGMAPDLVEGLVADFFSSLVHAKLQWCPLVKEQCLMRSLPLPPLPLPDFLFFVTIDQEKR